MMFVDADTERLTMPEVMVVFAKLFASAGVDDGRRHAVAWEGSLPA